jgi:signal recognition particle GTPase
MTGQDAVNSAKAFNDALDLNGVIRDLQALLAAAVSKRATLEYRLAEDSSGFEHA